MLNTAPHSQDNPGEADRIVAQGPQGAIALAAVATALVIAMWLAFYFLVFLPRGPLQ